MDDVWIILVSHGNLSKELLGSAKMIIGDLNNVQAFSLVEGQSPEDLGEQISARLEQVSENSIILVDLFGGTPSNVVARLSNGHQYTVITGMNLGMLIEAEMLRYQNLTDNQELIREKLVSAGKNGVIDLQAKLSEMVDEGSEL